MKAVNGAPPSAVMVSMVTNGFFPKGGEVQGGGIVNFIFQLHTHTQTNHMRGGKERKERKRSNSSNCVDLKEKVLGFDSGKSMMLVSTIQGLESELGYGIIVRPLY